ncbi:hypothetical protein C8F04DRAFT_1061771 [Mycena alexandri]|uniref:Uncharacterized protein n=1 Tax=Mycena alexandri TaxID=1745969 RepID=A0AAD6XG46_9AGAR|nr:hypothetical protein C8F04DRAFT_1061771 [Mycena alexandri]
MALRRKAMNNASTSTSTPDTPGSAAASPIDGSPLSPLVLPQTPRNRASIFVDRSPAATPSISSNIAFDWDAARARKPAPYSTPQSVTKASRRSTMGTPGTPLRTRVVRKKGIVERITAIPSQIAFHIAIFPANVPLPRHQTSAWIIGGSLHFLHLCVRVSQIRKIPDSDLGWEDMYREGEGHSWFDWTVPMSIFLLTTAVLNAIYLFSRIKLYRLHMRPDPVSSPNAKFVAAQLDFQPLEPPPLTARIRKSLWYGFSISWRFLLGMRPPATPTVPAAKTARVQQLEVWTPGELELTLFNVYSPMHVFLWMATGSSNWMLMLLIMGLVGAQANAVTHSYKALIKDKEIIAAEVFHEYNQGFVYPRINPVRKDVAVMTHQSEVVNVWED